MGSERENEDSDSEGDGPIARSSDGDTSVDSANRRSSESESPSEDSLTNLQLPLCRVSEERSQHGKRAGSTSGSAGFHQHFVCDEVCEERIRTAYKSSLLTPLSRPQLPVGDETRRRNGLGKPMRTVLVTLIAAVYFVDTCATTVFVPLVPGYFNTSETDIKIGALFGAKAAAQIIANPFWGAVTDHLGGMPTLLITSGLYILIMLLNAFAAQTASRYAVVVAARVLLGVASAGAGTGGMALIAAVYMTNRERGAMLGRVLAGFAVGAMAGAPVGGALSLNGDVDAAWKLSFLLLTGLSGLLLLSLVVFWLILPPVYHCTMPIAYTGKQPAPTSILTLLKDPYIVTMATVACVANMSVSALDPLLPEWATEHFSPEPSEWNIGLAYLPLFAAYFITTPVWGCVTHRYPAWILLLVALFASAALILVFPFVPAGSFWLLVAPMFGLGMVMGVIDVTTYYIMALFMDRRHSSTYGNVYAISDMAFSANYLLAPVLATGLAQAFGNDYAFYSLAILLAVSVPLTLIIRHEEKQHKVTSDSTAANRPPSSSLAPFLIYTSV